MNAASDETIMSDRNHPAHRAGPREGAAAGFIVFIALIVFWTRTDVSWLGFNSKLAVTIVLTSLAAFLVGRFFGRLGMRRKQENEVLYRAAQEEEKQRQIAEMKRKSEK